MRVMLPIPCASLDDNPILADTGGSLLDVTAELTPRHRPHFPKGVYVVLRAGTRQAGEPLALEPGPRAPVRAPAHGWGSSEDS